MKSNKNATENKKAVKSKSKVENRPKNTTNYAPDSHKKFCVRCYTYHGDRCPATGTRRPSKTCDL